MLQFSRQDLAWWVEAEELIHKELLLDDRHVDLLSPSLLIVFFQLRERILELLKPDDALLQV